MATCQECIPDSELPDWAQQKKDKEQQVTGTQIEITLGGQLLGAARSAIFVLGSAFLLFASLRNSVTWHFQHVWGASKNFWQQLWGMVLTMFGHNEFLISFVGTMVVTVSFFWVMASFFIFLDLTGKPEWLTKYKIQDGKQAKFDRKKFWNAVKVCLFNQLVIGGIVTFVLAYWMQSRFSFGVDELPSFHYVLFEMLVFVLIEEFMFYYSHRLFHHPRLYKYIHKKHHEWTAPVCIVCIYAHPVEHVISNLLPVTLGPFIMGSHCATTWLWFCIVYWSTLISHSGYHLPFLPSPEAHDYHHFKFINNFGVLGVLDRLHGTDNMFRKTKCYDRHIMLMGFVPLKESIPDNKCTCMNKKSC